MKIAASSALSSVRLGRAMLSKRFYVVARSNGTLLCVGCQNAERIAVERRTGRGEWGGRCGEGAKVPNLEYINRVTSGIAQGLLFAPGVHQFPTAKLSFMRRTEMGRVPWWEFGTIG